MNDNLIVLTICCIDINPSYDYARQRRANNGPNEKTYISKRYSTKFTCQRLCSVSVCVNSLMVSWVLSKITPDKNLLPNYTKPLPESMLTNHQEGHVAFIIKGNVQVSIFDTDSVVNPVVWYSLQHYTSVIGLWPQFYQTRSAWSIDQVSSKKRSAVHNFVPTVTKFCVTCVGPLALTNDTIYGPSNVSGPASGPLWFPNVIISNT